MENSETVQQEITQLEQQLAEKRASLEQQSAETQAEVSHEKELLRQVVGEKIQESRLEESRILDLQSKSGQAPHDQSSYNDPQLADKIQELVNLAFNKSIDHAVKSVVQSSNPALIDAFHDVLVDKLYDTLIERRKLDIVK